MGQIIRAKKIRDAYDQIPGLIVFCTDHIPIAYEQYSLGIPLAKAIIKVGEKNRQFKLKEYLEEIIMSLPTDVVLTDIDILFNPSYKIDVLKLLIVICKAKSFSVFWPGVVSDGKLTYAEDGYKDYKTYSINDYDITCIVE